MRRLHDTALPLAISDEVATALAEAQPVVALESNVITHGLPYPDNIVTACRVEQAVRDGGAVPATIGIDAGRIIVGMTAREIEQFASTSGIPKVSTRDIPVILAAGGAGATTVASSLALADIAGIAVFSSAGIGGVHRGAESTMDISSDLIQLTRSRVAVVCAGGKSILDLGLTMEVLETQCVPVIAFRSDDFPAFYCPSSGIRSPHRLDDETAVARAIEYHWSLGGQGSVLITTPIRDADAIDRAEIDEVIATAVAAARRDGVRGNALTRYLMRAVERHTGGRSTRANMSVLISTAELAGRLASAHARVRRMRREVRS